MDPSATTESEIAAYRKALLSYAYRLTGDAHEAEDVVQTALMRAWEALRGGRDVRNVRAWLYRITHNEAMSARRRSRVRLEARALETFAGPVPSDASERVRRFPKTYFFQDLTAP